MQDKQQLFEQLATKGIDVNKKEDDNTITVPK